MEKDINRLKVIENIKKSVENNELNNKVELGDPTISEEQVEKYIVPFDIMRKNPVKKFKQFFARAFANAATFNVNKDTEIIGIENLKVLKKTGAIITCNHYNFVDTTIIRKFVLELKRERHFYIMIEDTNVLMKGFFGFLFNNCSTIPINQDKLYLKNNFYPSVEKILKRKGLILIYPEQEMWFNYRKPRPFKHGAYHIATKYNVPIIPCFTELREKEGYDNNGFKKTKYILHIMPPIFPDENLTIKENKDSMLQKDFEYKVEAYEKAYGKKLDYKFSNWDIAGLQD